jgi:putative transposase
MDTERATHEIARMARLLEVSRSGYYAWAERQAAGPGSAQQRRDELTVKIIGFHADSDRVCMGRRGSLPTCAPTASGSRRRRSRS